MTNQADARTPVFRVLDAMDHPHGGRILRLRLETGDPPPVSRLDGGLLEAVSPDSEARGLRVKGFAAFGGKVSDERLARTGRVDVHVYPEDGETAPPVGIQWEVRGPVEGS